MITRIGHIALRVRDLDAAVEFHQDVLGLTEVDRLAGAAYLSCNERHHELIVVEDRHGRGYEHIGLQVESPDALDRLARTASAAGGTVLGGTYDGEPGIDRARLVRSPNGHVYKLFHGMDHGPDHAAPGGAVKFEHVSTKVLNLRAEERFLRDGLGLRFSDRMGFLASWWHCDEDHHGIALVLAPRPELSHYAFAFERFADLGPVADRLLVTAGRKCIWGPSRHGPGNNHFLYFHDPDGAMIECCSELAQMEADDYAPRNWSMHPRTINQWGGPPPARFIATGFPIAPARPGRPTWAVAGDRTLEAAR